MEEKQELSDKINQFSIAVEKTYRDCKKFASIAEIQYPAMQEDLDNARRLFPAYRRKLKAVSRNVSEPEGLEEKIKGTAMLKFYVTVNQMKCKFNLALYDRAIEYSESMDNQFDSFYKKMVDNLLGNIKDKTVAVPKIPPTMPEENNLIGTESDGSHQWAKMFIRGVLPNSGNLEPFQKIMAEYDVQLDKAYKLWEATKDTVLDTTGIYAVVAQHRMLFTDEGGRRHMGGKRGKINFDYQILEMTADRKGLYADVIFGK
jgi:hypothetical protein